MRVLLLTLVVSTLAFAGCIDNGGVGTDSVATGSQTEQLQSISTDDGLPPRYFEPEIIFEANETELEKGDNVLFTFNITDLHDYEYPMSFVDWNVTYAREPNPVIEGDAFDLPATYNRTLFAEAWHLFSFNYDDGQGFNGSKVLAIKVGDPPELAEEDLEEVVFVDPCEGAAVQAPVEQTMVPVVIGGAAGSGFVYTWSFEVTPCQKVIVATVSPTYGDIMLEIHDPAGSSVASADVGFVAGAESIRYEPGEALEPGTWGLYVRPFASGPDLMDFHVAFE